MQIIDPQVQEQVIDLHAATQSTQSAPQAAPVQAEDPTVALPKYKALLDARLRTVSDRNIPLHGRRSGTDRSEEETAPADHPRDGDFVNRVILQEYGLEKTAEKDITENRTAGSVQDGESVMGWMLLLAAAGLVTFGGILRRHSKIHL